MKVLLGKYHIGTCHQYQRLLDENRVNYEFHEPPMVFGMLGADEYPIGEIYVSEEDFELAKLIVDESEAYSRKTIEENLKPQIKSQFTNGFRFVVGFILLGLVLLPFLSGGKYDFIIVMGIIVAVVIFIRRKPAKGQKGS